MPGDPPEELTPPGPPTGPEPETPTPTTGGRSVDDWIAENRGRSQASPYPAQPNPYATQTELRLGEASRYDAGTSRKMAGWALGLSLVFCIPFGFLVAIGLAITVLVRSRGGGDHGKGMAIAALIISGLIIIANVVYVVVILFAGVDTTDRDSEGNVIDGGTVTLDRLRVGDCFNEPNFEDLPADGSQGEASASVEVVPCREPHQAEVYHSLEVTGDDFPGESAIDRQAAECVPEFKEYVGKPYGRSRLEITLYYPTSSSWRLGDRTVLCNLVERDLSDMTGSKRNSRQ
jgi:hypothetical protein